MSLAPSTVFLPPACMICVPRPMLSSSRGWESREETGGERAFSQGGEGREAGNRSVGLSCSASPSEWPLCCTRPGPPTATGLGGQNMHRWTKGRGSPCPWGTRASGQPLCMCWGTSCRALGSWPPLSSSTSRYCACRPAPAFVPRSAPCPPPGPLGLPPHRQLPAPQYSRLSAMVPFPSAGLSGASQVLFVQDTPRSSPGGFLSPGLGSLSLSLASVQGS